jgi:hypothetical protein
MNRLHLAIAFFSLITLMSGCTATTGVTPSQNNNLQAVSPSGTAASNDGAMQRSLDLWLKEEWSPMTTSSSSAGQPLGSIPKEELDSRLRGNDENITTTAPDGKVITTTTPVVAEPVDKTPFTLQKYADKWKVYHENMAKMNEGKPKEVSNVEKLESMPAIGK